MDQLNSVTQAINARRMTRRYTGSPLAPGVMDLLVDLGRKAPTAGGTDGIRLHPVGPDRIDALAAICREAEFVARGFEPWISSAGGSVCVGADERAYRARYQQPDKELAALSIPWWWFDAGAAVENMLIGAEGIGLGAGFLGAHAIEGLSEFAGWPASLVHPVGVVTIGHKERP